MALNLKVHLANLGVTCGRIREKYLSVQRLFLAESLIVFGRGLRSGTGANQLSSTMTFPE